MSTLPRVEQPYSVEYPQLNVYEEVEVVIESTESHGVLHISQESTDENIPPINPPSFAQFNLSGYVGGTINTKRYLPLKHRNNVPPISVDPKISKMNVGYIEMDAKSTVTPTKEPTLIRPDATMSIYRPFTFEIPDSVLDIESFLTKHIQVEYDIDETDLGILGLLATRYHTQMSPEVFEVLMSMLDYSAALICLKMHPLERATKEACGALNTVDNRRCAVCNWAECTDSNTIVFCDGCDVAVHQDCYGVHSIPEGRWLCRKCESGHADDIRCIMCPHISGAFKRTMSGDWIHLVCALWIPIVKVPEDTSFLEPIRDIELMDPERWTLNCYVCRLKNIGACIQCAARDCYAAFHPTCAQAAGFYMTNCDHDFSEMLKQQQFLPVYCHRHSLAHAPKNFPIPNLDAARQELAEEKKQQQKRNVSLFAKPRFRSWRTKNHTLILPNIVVNAVQRSLRNRLHVDISTEAIEFLCRYWTVKKDHNDGVMFNRRMYHALEVAEHRHVRAEQSDEQEFTPTELLDIVNKLLEIVNPQEKSREKLQKISQRNPQSSSHIKPLERQPPPPAAATRKLRKRNST